VPSPSTAVDKVASLVPHLDERIAGWNFPLWGSNGQSPLLPHIAPAVAGFSLELVADRATAIELTLRPTREANIVNVLAQACNLARRADRLQAGRGGDQTQPNGPAFAEPPRHFD